MPRYALLLLLGAIPSMTFAADYQTQLLEQDGLPVVRLTDARHKVTVSVVPGIGNIAYSMVVNGHEILRLPTHSLAELKAKPGLGGVPFLAPWANRIDGMAYWANGKKYLLNGEIGTVRLDPNGLPIHGLLSFSPDWSVVAHESDGHAAWVTSRLEFWKHADFMAQFPFAHTIEMTYRLHDGQLDVETVLRNLSVDPMPVAIGFHPYFQLDDAPRDAWTVHLAAASHLILNNKLTPTGERKPMDLPDPLPLAGHTLDDGFVDLVGAAPEFWVRGKSQQISVIYGKKFPVAVAYAPPGQSFICFEPMTAVTDGFNLAHAGKWDGLQTVAPGGEWRETFQIRPSGF